MCGNVALEKSRRFAVRIVRLYKVVSAERHESVLSKQLLRSGTSIGANLAEAEYAMSRGDFAAKVYIALKECGETAYWLELLHASDYLTDAEYKSVIADCREILYILRATTRTIREKNEGK